MRINQISLFIGILVVLLMDNALATAIRPFSGNERKMISKGFELFKSGTFVGKYADGCYTDPNEKTKVYDFWSNGKWAKYDREGDGHHETMFQIKGNQIDYVGTIGGDAKFITVDKSYKEFLGLSYWEWLKTIK
jgi:hypothetical protein